MGTILTCVRVWSLACDLYVSLKEALEGDVGREALHPVVGDAVLGSAFRALHLQEAPVQ